MGVIFASIFVGELLSVTCVFSPVDDELLLNTLLKLSLGRFLGLKMT